MVLILPKNRPRKKSGVLQALPAAARRIAGHTRVANDAGDARPNGRSDSACVFATPDGTLELQEMLERSVRRTCRHQRDARLVMHRAE